jgi:hypothetical protein
MHRNVVSLIFWPCGLTVKGAFVQLLCFWRRMCLVLTCQFTRPKYSGLQLEQKEYHKPHGGVEQDPLLTIGIVQGTYSSDSIFTCERKVAY